MMNLVKLSTVVCSVLFLLFGSIEAKGGRSKILPAAAGAVVGGAVGAYAMHKIMANPSPKVPVVYVDHRSRTKVRTHSKHQFIYLMLVNRMEWKANKLSELNIRPGDSFSKVIVHHTNSADCYNLFSCTAVLKEVERKNMESQKLDNIGYNFMIGGDGRIYENLGWTMFSKIINSSALNPISLQVAFIGDFRVFPPNQKQLDAFDALIKYGDKKDYLKKYVIHGYRDVSCTNGPGDALYGILKKMNRYRPLLDQSILCVGKTETSGMPVVNRTEWNAVKLTELNIRPTNSFSKVIVHHTASSGCHNVNTCSLVLKEVERKNMDSKKLDNIGYNFMIGGDGKIYDNLGWTMYSKIVNNPTLDPTSLQVAFIGDFTVYPPNEAQLDAFKALIKYGDKKDFLKKYSIHGVRDVSCTSSPGEALYAVLKKMPRYKPLLHTSTLC